VLNFIQFYARKLLLSINNTVVLKLIFICKVFSTKLYAHEMFGSQEFETTFFWVVPKSICGPLVYSSMHSLVVFLRRNSDIC